MNTILYHSPTISRVRRFPLLARRCNELIGAVISLVALGVGANCFAQATYDVWGGNTLDFNHSYYAVDKIPGYVKLGSTNRTATFFGSYRYVVVVVRNPNVLYLDAAQTSAGNFYNSGTIASGNVGDTVDGAYGAPDRIYMRMDGTAAGGGVTYGSYAIFYNTGGWTSMKFFVYEPQAGPGLTGHPKRQIQVVGQDAGFSLQAIGAGPLHYQWRKGGVHLSNDGRISGATSTNLSLSAVTLADSGNYSVVVTNLYGSVTSAASALTVVSPAPANYDVWGGNTLDFNQNYYNVDRISGYVKLGTTNRTATFHGKYNYYVMAARKSDLVFVDAAQVSSGVFYPKGSLATGNTGGDAPFGPPDARYMILNGPGAGASPESYGSYAIFYNTRGWTNIKFFTYSLDALPTISSQPHSQKVASGTTVQFSVLASSDAPFGYQWRKDGKDLLNGGRITGAKGATLNISSAQAPDSGSYSVVVTNAYGSMTSIPASLDVVTPPSSFVLSDYFYPLVAGNEWRYTGTDYDGQPARRIARVDNLSTPVTAYRGRRAPQPYVTNLVQLYAAYAFPNSVTPFDDWREFFKILDGRIFYWGDDDDGEALRADGGAALPYSLALGQSASVTRDMYDNGVFLGPATLKVMAVSWGSVTVPAGTFEDCIQIRITISSGGGSQTQDEWWARGIGTVKGRNVPDDGEDQNDLDFYQVVSPVQIVGGPASRTNNLGTTATFSVTVAGTSPLTYLWKKNGTNLADSARVSGTSTGTLTIQDVDYPDADSYTVAVSNNFSGAVSAPAALIVKEAFPPSLAVTSHVNLQLVPSALVNLAGSASDAGSGDSGIGSVTINGVRATNDTAMGGATANWNRVQSLTSGTNTLTIVARDGQGNTTTNVLRLVSDAARPTAAITSPAANSRVFNPALNVSGKAADNRGVTSVFIQANGNAWQTASGTTNWSGLVNLEAGANTIRAYSVDSAGNTSLTNSVTITYVVTAPLALSVSGSGVVVGATNGQMLEVGRAYKLTAQPTLRNLFVNWSGDVSSTNPVITFSMQPNRAVQANFATNSFVALKGSYFGLISSTNSPRSHQHSGAFTFSLNEAGGFSGSFQLGSAKISGKGAFNRFGDARLTLKPSLTETVAVVMRLDVTNYSAWVSGSVGNEEWNSPLLGYRAPTIAVTKVSPFTGKYTLVIPGGTDPGLQPGGHGYGTVAVSPKGTLKLAAKLPDGATLSQSVPPSEDGWWAFHSTLYSGVGSLHGWMQFTNDLTSDLAGTLSWIKPASTTAKLYPSGFSTDHKATGSKYLAATTNRVLNLTNAELTLQAINSNPAITNSVLLAADNKILNLSSNKLTMTLTVRTGLLKGTVVETNTGRSIPFTGVLHQKLNSGYGYFQGTNQSGSVNLLSLP